MNKTAVFSSFRRHAPVLAAVLFLALTATIGAVAQNYPNSAASSWSIPNFPASGSAAVSTKAAGVANMRHVANCLSFSATATGVVTAATGNVFIQDGSSTVFELAVAFPTASAAGAVEIAPFSVCGLQFLGTAGNSMSAGFSAGVTGVQQSVTLTGYDIAQ